MDERELENTAKIFFLRKLGWLGVDVRWESLLEVEVIGYNLYRSEGLPADALRLNTTLIEPQPGENPFETNYRFLDDRAQQGVTYQYWLEVVSTLGSEQLGPVQIQLHRVLFPVMGASAWSTP